MALGYDGLKINGIPMDISSDDTVRWIPPQQGVKLPTKTHTFGSPEYLELLDKMRDLHIRKNQGYSAASKVGDCWHNFRQCENFGIPAPDGVITRMSDKWSRLQSLWLDRANDKVDEPIEDTLMDLAAYSLILICLLKEQKDTSNDLSDYEY